MIFLSGQRAGQARLAACGVTARETEVLAAIGRRLTNREIAGRMFISVRTGGLEHRFGVLERPGRAGRHRSLSSAIAWSWDLLDDAERSLLRRLAVLPGEFTLALAQALGLAGVDPRTVLMRLVERSLVSMRLPEGAPARYWLLRVIRAFALERPAPAVDEQVRRAHAQFFCDVAAAAVRIGAARRWPGLAWSSHT